MKWVFFSTRGDKVVTWYIFMKHQKLFSRNKFTSLPACYLPACLLSFRLRVCFNNKNLYYFYSSCIIKQTNHFCTSVNRNLPTRHWEETYEYIWFSLIKGSQQLLEKDFLEVQEMYKHRILFFSFFKSKKRM